MKSETKKGTLMTEGSIVKNILFFAIPLILGNLLQQLYNTADSIIVGNFVGKNALAAVGSSTSVIYLLIAFSQGASVGAGVVVSQYLGARKKKETEDAVHTALAISVILGVILTIVFCSAADFFCGCIPRKKYLTAQFSICRFILVDCYSMFYITWQQAS